MDPPATVALTTQDPKAKIAELPGPFAPHWFVESGIDEDDAMCLGREGEEKHHQARYPELKMLEHEHIVNESVVVLAVDEGELNGEGCTPDAQHGALQERVEKPPKGVSHGGPDGLIVRIKRVERLGPEAVQAARKAARAVALQRWAGRVADRLAQAPLGLHNRHELFFHVRGDGFVSQALRIGGLMHAGVEGSSIVKSRWVSTMAL